MEDNANVSAAPAENAPEPSGESAASTATVPAENAAASEDVRGSDIRLRVDPVTGQRTVEYGELPKEDSQPEQPPAQPQYYTDSELLQAIGNNNVLAGKVSPEQQQFIQAQQNYFMQQVQEQQKQAEIQRYIKENSSKLMADSLSGIDGAAKERAMQVVGLSEDDYNNIEFIADSEQKKAAYQQAYQNAYAEMAYKIAEQNLQQAQQMQQYQKSINEIGSFIRAEQRAEPKCAEVLKLMDTAVDEMPYSKAIKYKTAWQNFQNGICSDQDLSSIREYYDDCKKMVYQQSVGIPKVPQRVAVPKVETSGQPNPQAKQPMDFAKLRGMSQRDRDSAIMSYLSNI